jgi:hypothetical protein
MSYLGRGLDKISNIEILDNITFDGSSSYSITKSSVAFVPNSAQSLLISIDGVVQATNFTISGSTIDFGVAVPSTSTCNFFLHYGTGVAFIPTDGSVSLAKLSATGTKDATTFLRGDNTFQTIGTNTPAFRAYTDTVQTTSASVITKAELDLETYDTDSCYDTSTYRFTPNVAGKYYFNFVATDNYTTTAANDAYIYIRKNGSDIAEFGINTKGSQYGTLAVSTTVDMNGSSDYVEFFLYHAGGSGVIWRNNSDRQYAEGYRLIT